MVPKLPEIYSDLLSRKRSKMIPFSVSSEIDYDRIEKVESEEIYKDLREID